MARKNSSRARPLALEMLEADHRKVEALFEQYEEEKESGEETKQPIAERICGELTVHAQVEEEIFYPWLRENLSDEEMELVEEALVEHATAKDLIAQLEGAEIDETYDAKVKVLSEYIKHHVQEEENEIFEQVADKQEELDELGQQMAARKAELMEEMGLMEEDADEAMQAGAMGGRGKSRGSAAQRGAR
jgi:hemerythrin-like domain-containing protein